MINSHFYSFQYGPVFSFTMAGKNFTYLIGSDAASTFFNSKNEDLNAQEVYGKLVTPVFGKRVAYDVPNKVRHHKLHTFLMKNMTTLFPYEDYAYEAFTTLHNKFTRKTSAENDLTVHMRVSGTRKPSFIPPTSY